MSVAMFAPREHDNRKGRHYYIRHLCRPISSYIVVTTLAVVMGVGGLVMGRRGSSCGGGAHHASQKHDAYPLPSV
jgi:hypothetical protein